MVKIKLLLNVLTVCIAVVGYLPLQPYLGPFARVFLPGALLLGLYLQWKERPLSARVLTPSSIILFLFFAYGFRMDRLVPVTADLLVVFLGVRLLGERSGRNSLQVFALSLFCLAASSLYSLSELFLVYLLLLLLLLAVSLVVLTFHSHDPDIVLPRDQAKTVLSVSTLIPVASLPLLLFFFLILPRTQYPLWNFATGQAGKKTGFSDVVKPGETSTVAEVKGVVLRAICSKVPEQQLYWRGIVLNGFKEDAWVRLPPPREFQLPPKGETLSQEIYPEPSQSIYLPALNVASAISGVRNEKTPDGVFTGRGRLDKRVKYNAESVLSDVVQVKGGIDRDFYLKLPANVPDRMRAKGRELNRPGIPAAERMRLLERFFHEQKLSYATTRLPVGADPLGSFLFDKRRGNCEYFASCYALLLRLAGVPSRLVGGYRGGTYNAMGGYYLVTEEMAHVWVEAYLDGVGWQFVDPSAWAIGLPRPNERAGALRMYLDAAGFYWNKAVVTYDLEMQMDLVRSAGNKARNIRLPAGTARMLATLLIALLPVAALLAWYLRRPGSAEERVLKRMLRAVEKRHPGEARGNEGLFELAARLNDSEFRQFVSLYGDAVYRDRHLNREELARLDEIIRKHRQHGS
ncbi:MAG TPA: DUF3488 domain-containing protein [Geobacter sp.]|nr:DUF3488 domain-containing protein [Geobacter sp.]